MNLLKYNLSINFLIFHIIIARTTYLQRPEIHSRFGKYGIAGKNLTLDCKIEVVAGIRFLMTWSLPNNLSTMVNICKLTISIKVDQIVFLKKTILNTGKQSFKITRYKRQT